MAINSIEMGIVNAIFDNLFSLLGVLIKAIYSTIVLEKAFNSIVMV